MCNYEATRDLDAAAFLTSHILRLFSYYLTALTFEINLSQVEVTHFGSSADFLLYSHLSRDVETN